MRQAKIVKVIFFLVFFTMVGGSCEGGKLCLANCSTIKIVSPKSGTVLRQDDAPMVNLRIEVDDLPQDRLDQGVEIWTDGAYLFNCPINAGVTECGITLLSSGTHQIQARIPLPNGNEITDRITLTWHSPAPLEKVVGKISSFVGIENASLDAQYFFLFLVTMLILSLLGLWKGGPSGAWILVVIGGLCFIGFLIMTQGGTLALFLVGLVVVTVFYLGYKSRYTSIRWGLWGGHVEGYTGQEAPAAIQIARYQRSAGQPALSSGRYRVLDPGVQSAEDEVLPEPRRDRWLKDPDES